MATETEPMIATIVYEFDPASLGDVNEADTRRYARRCDEALRQEFPAAEITVRSQLAPRTRVLDQAGNEAPSALQMVERLTEQVWTHLHDAE